MGQLASLKKQVIRQRGSNHNVRLMNTAKYSLETSL